MKKAAKAVEMISELDESIKVVGGARYDRGERPEAAASDEQLPLVLYQCPPVPLVAPVEPVPVTSLAQDKPLSRPSSEPPWISLR